MTAKTERKRIQAVAKKWRDVLAMYEWNVTHRFTDGALIIDGVLNTRASGCANVDWPYRQATLEFNVQATAKLTDAELEECYVHEVMHVYLNEMREGEINHEERVATSLSYALIRAMKVKP